MKSVIKYALVVSFSYCLTGCIAVVGTSTGPGHSSQAPGQIKKTTGSQSAKPYAPGQQKKKN